MKTQVGEITVYRVRSGVIAIAIREGQHNFLDLKLTDEQAELFQFELIQALMSRRHVVPDAFRQAVAAGEARDD